MMMESESPKTVDSASTAPSTPQVKLGHCTAVRTGLRNLGRTCYANCVLQTLYANDALRRLVLSYHPPNLDESSEIDNSPTATPTGAASSPASTPDKMNKSICLDQTQRQKIEAARTLVALQELFATMRFGPWPVASPKNVLICFMQACKARTYDFVTQEDPNEFMTHLLEVLSMGFLLGSCHVVTRLSLQSPGDKTVPLLLRTPTAHIVVNVIDGIEAQRQFKELLTGEAINLLLEDQTTTTTKVSSSSSSSTGTSSINYCHCTKQASSSGGCPIFGIQKIDETVNKLCDILPKSQVVTVERQESITDETTVDDGIAHLNPSDWHILKVLGLAENQSDTKAEVFREIHLGNETFDNLADALMDYQFTDTTSPGVRQEWWTLRTPRVWHFTLHRSMWSDDQAWKSSRAFQMPPEISVGHLCIQNRSRVLQPLYRALDRINALKRLSVWHTGFPVSARETLSHEAVFTLGQEAARSLEGEVTTDKEKLVVEKLLRCLRLAQQVYKGVKDKVSEKRRRLLCETPMQVEEPRLQLSSVWVHDGPASGHGHFWCLLRQGNTWLKLNDDKVQIPSEREVEDILNPDGSTSTYCAYSALYEEVNAVTQAAEHILSSKTFAESKCTLTPSEAMEYYEYYSLPEPVRNALCATATAESDWAVGLQTVTSLRLLAVQYLDDLMETINKTVTYMKDYEPLQMVFRVLPFENGSTPPLMCSDVVATIQHIPLPWVIENRLLYLWTTLLSTVCLQDLNRQLLPYKLGAWVCGAYASDLYKHLLAQHPEIDSESLQAAIMSLVSESNNPFTHILLRETPERIFLFDLEKYDPLCSPFHPPEQPPIKIFWEALCAKYDAFVSNNEKLKKALELIESEDIDVGYCQLALLLVTVDCMFLNDFIRGHLISLHASWMEVLRNAPGDLITRAMRPEFSILLKVLVPAGYLLQAYCTNSFPGDDSYRRSEAIVQGLLYGLYKREFVELQKSLAVLRTITDWKIVEAAQALDTCKSYIAACCGPLATWTRRPNAEVSTSPVFQRMLNVYQSKVQ